jgi:Protein of unknown function (DUF4231)
MQTVRLPAVQDRCLTQTASSESNEIQVTARPRITAVLGTARAANVPDPAVAPEPDTRAEYLDQLRKEIRNHARYFVHQIRLYRFFRVVVVVAAGAVPVLATVSGVPRWTLGVFGAIAAASEAVQQLFQYRRSALQAMVAGNDLERELRLYLIAVDPYAEGDDDAAFRRLAVNAERIRRRAEAAFLDTWQRDERAGTGSAEASEADGPRRSTPRKTT